MLKNKYEILTERLALTPLSQNDKEFYIELTTDEQVMKYVSGPLTREQAIIAFTERSKEWTGKVDSWLSFLVKQIDHGQKIGCIGVRFKDANSELAEVGFILGPKFQGQGFAKEALMAVCHFTIRDLGISKIHAFCATKNKASSRVLEHCGFLRCALLERNTEIGGVYMDDYRYELSLKQLK